LAVGNHAAFLAQFQALVALKVGTSKDWRSLLLLAGRGLRESRSGRGATAGDTGTPMIDWPAKYLAELSSALETLANSKAIAVEEIQTDPALANLIAEPGVSAVLKKLSSASGK
jgi:hypothetical protein